MQKRGDKNARRQHHLRDLSLLSKQHQSSWPSGQSSRCVQPAAAAVRLAGHFRACRWLAVRGLKVCKTLPAAHTPARCCLAATHLRASFHRFKLSRLVQPCTTARSGVTLHEGRAQSVASGETWARTAHARGREGRQAPCVRQVYSLTCAFAARTCSRSRCSGPLRTHVSAGLQRRAPAPAPPRCPRAGGDAPAAAASGERDVLPGGRREGGWSGAHAGPGSRLCGPDAGHSLGQGSPRPRPSVHFAAAASPAVPRKLVPLCFVGTAARLSLQVTPSSKTPLRQ